MASRTRTTTIINWMWTCVQNTTAVLAASMGGYCDMGRLAVGVADGVGVAVPGDEVLETWSRSKRSRSRTRALLRPAVACAVQLPMMPAK